MKVDLRDTLLHLGDIFVGAIEKTVDTANKCAQGVALAYDVRDLQKKRRQILAEIGERLTQVTKEGLTDVRRDDKLMELFSKLEAMENTIQAKKSAREAMNVCGCTKTKAPAAKAPETKAIDMNVAESAAS
jgi:small-conductance mechanosensitive channel